MNKKSVKTGSQFQLRAPAAMATVLENGFDGLENGHRLMEMEMTVFTNGPRLEQVAKTVRTNGHRSIGSPFDFVWKSVIVSKTATQSLRLTGKVLLSRLQTNHWKLYSQNIQCARNLLIECHDFMMYPQPTLEDIYVHRLCFCAHA